MKTATRRGIIALMGFMVLLWIIGDVFLPPIATFNTERHSSVLYDLNHLWFVLASYELDHGHFPYDERGPGYALFKLEDPYFLACFPDIMPRSAWNFEEKRVDMNAVLFKYANPIPNSFAETNYSDLLLLWAPINGDWVCATAGGRLIVTNNLQSFLHNSNKSEIQQENDIESTVGELVGEE